MKSPPKNIGTNVLDYLKISRKNVATTATGTDATAHPNAMNISDESISAAGAACLGTQ